MRLAWILGVILGLSGNAEARTYLGYSFAGLSYHGEQVDPELAGEMPNRLTDDGRFIKHFNEQILSLETPSAIVTLGHLKDCFNQSAVFFAIGPNWQAGTWGFALPVGVYARKPYYFIDNEGKRARAKEMPYMLDSGDYQVMPLIFASATKHWLIWERVGVQASLSTNVVITHFDLGIFAAL